MATRADCDMEGQEHALVKPAVDVRDNLGVLAVQILSARENLAGDNLNYREVIHKLYDITCDLHEAYGREFPNLHV